MAFYLGDDLASTSHHYGDLAMVEINRVSNDGRSKGFHAQANAVYGSVARFVHVRVVLRCVEVQLVASDRGRAISERTMAFLVQFAPAFRGICAFRSVIAMRASDVIFGGGFGLLIVRRTLLRGLQYARRELASGRVCFQYGSNGVGHFFADHVATASCNGRFLAVRRAVTNDADTSARSHVFLFIFRTRVLDYYPNESGRHLHFSFFFSIGHCFVEDLTRVHYDDGARACVYPGTTHLYARVFRRLQSTSAFQVAKRIFGVHDYHRLATKLRSFVGRQARIYASHVGHYHVSNES